MNIDRSQLQIDTSLEHSNLKWALNSVQLKPPKSVFQQPFQQPDPKQVNACLHWLDAAAMVQGILLNEEWGERGRRESQHFYHLKHLAEESTGVYVTTDAFATAAITANGFQCLRFPHLKFKMPRKEDVEAWGMQITKPAHNMLLHMAGRNVCGEQRNLQILWNGATS